jgi:hypothetical protein
MGCCDGISHHSDKKKLASYKKAKVKVDMEVVVAASNAHNKVLRALNRLGWKAVDSYHRVCSRTTVYRPNSEIYLNSVFLLKRGQRYTVLYNKRTPVSGRSMVYGGPLIRRSKANVIVLSQEKALDPDYVKDTLNAYGFAPLTKEVGLKRFSDTRVRMDHMPDVIPIRWNRAVVPFATLKAHTPKAANEQAMKSMKRRGWLPK